ncbi:MAG TPA: response regulator, partial [Burkholderiales bacterium]|nr:response regulator [Burkholderiales bacterium]
MTARRPTALIADDEPLLRSSLKRMLAEAWPELEVIAEARNGREAVDQFEALKPDICFLDVHMPGLSGVEAARQIGRRARLVFVTAYDQYAVEAFQHEALDYLVKPLHVERFEAALQRVRDRLHLMEAAGLAARLTALLNVEKAERERCGVERLTVPIATGDLIVPVADIDWIGADDYYACLHVGPK